MAIVLSAEAGPSTPPPGRQPRYKLAHKLSAHTNAVTALECSADGRLLVSAGADGMIHVWDPVAGELKRSFRAHQTGINDISISPDSLYLATASDDRKVLIHSLSALPTASTSRHPPPLRSFSQHTAPVLSVAFNPKSNLLVSGSIDESAIVWDVKGEKVLRALPAHSDAVWTVGWDNEGGMVITGSADGLIRLWDASTGQCLKTLDNGTNSPVSYAAFTPSSTFLISCTLSSTLRLYDIHTSKVLKTLRAPGVFVSERFPCPAVIFPALAESEHVNGDHLAPPRSNGHQVNSQRVKSEAWVGTGSEDGKLVLWELSSRRVVQVLEGHSASVIAIAVSPDGRTIVTGSLEPEKVIHIWRDQS